jgi:hypothetical protein
MVPTSQIALAILLLAIAPGYITSAAWARARTWKGPSTDFRTIIQALVLSAVVQALISPLTVLWIMPVRSDLVDHPWRAAIWILLSVIVVPIVLGLGSARATDRMFNPSDVVVKGKLSKFINKIVPATTPPTAWDWLFIADRFPRSGFMVVDFNDGPRVAGAFAQDSIALTSPEVHGLFLEVEWQLNEDGDIDAPLPGSGGLLIPRADNIRWVRILEAGDTNQMSENVDDVNGEVAK